MADPWQPLAVDLFCGLGGWTEGLLAEGYYVVGFDIERHRYPRTVARSDEAVKRPGMNWSDQSKRGAKDAMFNLPPTIAPGAEWMEYPAQLVLQDILTLHGRQFKDAALIVASPPCQGYSYRAMPWSRAKALPPPDNSLFEACFRIQREACEAAGKHIPMVVENVRGAQKWVGRARWNFGSYYLWGDVPALMPMTKSAMKNGSGGSWFGLNPDGSPGALNNARDGQKVASFRFDGSGRSFQTASVEGIKSTQDGLGGYGGSSGWNNTPMRRGNSKSNGRKAASAAIAKIPFPLAQYIAKTYKPQQLTIEQEQA